MSTSAYHEQRTYPDHIRLHSTPLTGLEFLAHWHQDHELIFITGGQQVIGINQQQFQLSVGHIVLIAQRDIHYFTEHQNTAGFMFIFRDKWISHLLPEASWHWYIEDPDQLDELVELARQIVLENNSRTTHNELAAEGHLQLFLSSLLKNLSPDSSCEIVSSGQQRMAYMQEILSYIDDHFCAPLTREDIASQFHLSVSHFTRLFRAATGQTLTDYLARKRIESVCHELQQTDLPVTEIALQHGYSSIRTFNRVFQKIMGVAPSAVRVGEL